MIKMSKPRCAPKKSSAKAPAHHRFDCTTAGGLRRIADFGQAFKYDQFAMCSQPASYSLVGWRYYVRAFKTLRAAEYGYSGRARLSVAFLQRGRGIASFQLGSVFETGGLLR
jgi:hypothetical protein